MTGMEALRTAAPYLSQFRGQTFVVKLGGEVIENPAWLRSAIEQIALLWHLGIRIVTVHGGGNAADEVSRRLGLTPEKVNGRRVTDAAALEVVKMTLAGRVHVDLLSAFRAVQLPCVGLSGLDSGLLVATKRPPVQVDGKTVDFGFVGDIAEVQPKVVTDLLDSGYLPVIAPLSATAEGEPLNTNADTVASAIAQAIGAEKLVFVVAVPGVLRDVAQPSSLIPFMTLADADEAMASGLAQGGMLPKLKAATEALRGGVHAVHLIGAGVADAMLTEVFTNEGSGTMIQAEPS